jgi:hypothetical protein
LRSALAESQGAAAEAAILLTRSKPMTNPPYSYLFSCLYDQLEPVGRLGRGAHYSVFRTTQWRDINGDELKQARIHDFAVIWDEDHDTRVIRVAERLHMAGLLFPIAFIGERKGVLTVLFDHTAGPAEVMTGPREGEYLEEVGRIAADGDNDHWTFEYGYYHRPVVLEEGTSTTAGGIINDVPEKVVPYLQAIDALWQVGEKLTRSLAT